MKSKQLYRLLAALIVLAGAAAALVALTVDRDSGDGTSSSAGGVPTDAILGAGTDLPDGLEVPTGASLIGPALVTELDPSAAPSSWLAVMLVDDEPFDVWASLFRQLPEVLPELGGDDWDDWLADQVAASSCEIPDRTEGETCTFASGDERVHVSATLLSVAGDITGRYLLRLEVEHGDSPPDDKSFPDPDPPPKPRLPEPATARSRPAVGEPLATATLTSGGDYVVLEGSELLAQFHSGSLTGGFGVILRTTPGAKLDAVAEAYSAQANGEASDPVEPDETLEYAGNTIKIYSPPGQAGGYSGSVTSVETRDGAGYIFYELFND